MLTLLRHCVLPLCVPEPVRSIIQSAAHAHHYYYTIRTSALGPLTVEIRELLLLASRLLLLCACITHTIFTCCGHTHTNTQQHKHANSHTHTHAHTKCALLCSKVNCIHDDRVSQPATKLRRRSASCAPFACVDNLYYKYNQCSRVCVSFLRRCDRQSL